jgi:hypothetical protein
MIKFNHMTDKNYMQRVKYYLTKGQKEVENFNDFMLNAVERYFQTGDATHLNYAIHAGQAVQRYRMVMRTISGLSCHKFDKESKRYKGKMTNKSKFQKLITNDSWLAIVEDNIKKEQEHANTTPAWDWNKKKAMLVRLVKEAKKHGVDDREITEVVLQAEQVA